MDHSKTFIRVISRAARRRKLSWLYKKTHAVVHKLQFRFQTHIAQYIHNRLIWLDLGLYFKILFLHTLIPSSSRSLCKSRREPYMHCALKYRRGWIRNDARNCIRREQAGQLSLVRDFKLIGIFNSSLRKKWKKNLSRVLDVAAHKQLALNPISIFFSGVKCNISMPNSS